MKSQKKYKPYKEVQAEVKYIQASLTCVYQICEWLCGCSGKHALFCFPCLVFSGETHQGQKVCTCQDFRHLPPKIAWESEQFKLFQRTNYRLQIIMKTRKNNRNMFSKIISSVKLCGNFENLIFPVAWIQAQMLVYVIILYLKEYQNQYRINFQRLLHKICKKNEMKEQVNNEEYLAVMFDETTDIYDKTQTVIIVRYELQGNPVERFFFLNLINTTTEALSSVLFKQLQILIGIFHINSLSKLMMVQLFLVMLKKVCKLK